MGTERGRGGGARMALCTEVRISPLSYCTSVLFLNAQSSHPSRAQLLNCSFPSHSCNSLSPSPSYLPFMPPSPPPPTLLLHAAIATVLAVTPSRTRPTRLIRAAGMPVPRGSTTTTSSQGRATRGSSTALATPTTSCAREWPHCQPARRSRMHACQGALEGPGGPVPLSQYPKQCCLGTVKSSCNDNYLLCS